MKISNILLLYFILFIRCAVQGPPGGGPQDSIPPEIVEVYPPANSTGIEPLTDIYLKFSENMEHISVERSIFITPFPKEKLMFHWEGKKLYIIIKDRLLEGVTHVINVGTGAKDLRNNNIENSYSWSFSTGDKIDTCEISGNIFGEKDVSEILIWAFRIDENKLINPSHHVPDYTTQSSKNGEFKFDYLSKGFYRLFALKDIDNNYKYNIEKDYIGIPCCDLKLSEKKEKIENFFLFLSKEDTTAPYVVDIKAPDKNNIVIRFSEQIKRESIKNLSDFIIFTPDKTSSQVRIKGYNMDSREKSVMNIFTSDQIEGIKYSLDLSGIEDLFGNRISKRKGLISFIGSGHSDTTAPEILYSSPKDSLNNLPPNTIIEIQFSEPIDTSSVEKGFSLKDTDENLVSGKIIWKDLSYFVFFPLNPFEEEKGYNLSFDSKIISDLNGNKITEDFNLYFEIGESLSFGSISGEIRNKNINKNEKIIAILYDSQSMNEILRKEISGTGKYFINHVKPGKYTIFAFVDSDRNGVFTSGRSFPFKPSERFTFVSEPVIIRPGWDNENIDIIFYDYE
ncbi:MAG: Ig-like domain-containing protein [Candidatus Helarchaeota archaeon]|nr:Ig-like domain-containing protein [Candidatus Helarchaeota archaeon]